MQSAGRGQRRVETDREAGNMARVSEPGSTSKTRRLVVIDGANSLYRAFFAIPNLRAPDGTPTNAVYGFATMLGKVVREESPDWLVVAFDPRGGSFRRRIFDGYKATRDAQPEDLSTQIPIVRELIEAWGIPLIEVADFEADDVIATLVAHVGPDADVRIISTDKDLMQLVNERVQLVDSVKDLRYGPAEVEARFGVPPNRLLDLRALVGDPSDNIPGVKGIGEKGAAKLITEFGSLEALLDRAGEVSAKRAREALLEQRAAAELSKQLATLRADVPLPVPLDSLVFTPPDSRKLRALYERLGFSRLIASLDGLAERDGAPARVEVARESCVSVEIVTDAATFTARLASIDRGAPLYIDWLVGDGSAIDATPVGLGIAIGDERACYVPIVAEGLVAEAGLDASTIVATLASQWDEPGSGRTWCAIDSKQVQSLLAELGLVVPPPRDDFGIASFLLDPAGPGQLVAHASATLGQRLESWEDVAGRGARATSAEQLPVEQASRYVGEQVAAFHRLMPMLRERLAADGLLPLYENVELPLTAVLSRMERNGVRIDEERLSKLASEYTTRLAQIEEEIYALAGEKFLISSPKQLQVILFEKLALPAIKKTKTGYSTAEDVLEQLQVHHELPRKILDHRKLSKLMSTYIDALPPLINRQTGRIHPRFNQLGAATGRLSASHPNVQNIPIRDEDGARIREAFIPAEGRVMLSADYSQVELRILAHYSGDASLIAAFRNSEDIHRRTAAEVWNVSIEQVSPEQRARAKAVNFGIIYGSSAYGLANQLGIAAAEAQETIDAYFARYLGVRRFIDETIASAKQAGFVSTLLGRRRYLPDLTSRNRVLRQAAERMAVNTVIQGTAADLIKRAMVDVDRLVEEAGLSAAMILQVHDELVFEVTRADVDRLTSLLRGAMQGAMALAVPLVTDVGIGESWRESH
jgi:DNA polymerase-1